MRTRLANSTIPRLRGVYSRFARSSPWNCSPCVAYSGPRRFVSTRSPPEKPYYITTPIFYVNAAPHVGHLYTMVLTDIVKRWHVLKGNQAIMCTGTDEHGLKASNQSQLLIHMLTTQVQKAAAKAGVDPKAFCDKGADIFRVRSRSRALEISE